MDTKQQTKRSGSTSRDRRKHGQKHLTSESLEGDFALSREEKGRSGQKKAQHKLQVSDLRGGERLNLSNVKRVYSRRPAIKHG